METIYLICAIVGGTLVVCQFLTTLFGLGGGHDFTGGDSFDAGGHGDMTGHDVDQGDGSTWFLGLLTFRALSAALAFFGLTGMTAIRAQLHPVYGLLLATAAGAVAIYLIGWIMKLIASFNVDGTVRIDRAVGCNGSVYLPIPANKSGHGKVQINIMNRTMEYRAVADDAMPTGTPVTVLAILGSDVVEVGKRS